MTSKDVITEELLEGAYIRKDFQGFDIDYQVIHCLLNIYDIDSILEIGTNTGLGVNVIKSALPTCKVFSLDLDYESMMLNPSEFPIGANGEDRVGCEAKFPFNQLRGDSMKFDYSSLREIDAIFIDGCHDFDHPYHETSEVLTWLKPEIIIWHDADIDCVKRAIYAAINFGNIRLIDQYKIYEVEDCRIAYAVKQIL